MQIAAIFLTVVLSTFSFHQVYAQANVVPASGQTQGKPWLGIAIEKGTNGVLVKGAIPDTPAEQAGIKSGDEVLSIDGVAVKDPKSLIEIIQNSGIGQIVKVEIQRGKEKIIKSLKLVMRPDELKIIRDKLVDKQAPKFDFVSIHGNAPTSTSKTKGKVTIIEFWATWCPACRASHPKLSDFAGKNPEINVLAVSEEVSAVLKEYAKKIEPKFTIVQDAKQQSAQEWMASAIPMLVVIDRKGIVKFVTVGAGENLEEALNFALKLK